MGYGGGWVEMVMGKSVVVGGSAGDGQIGGGRISDGESVVVPISVLICFCLCFSVLVVNSAAVVVFFFFFFPGDCGCNNFSDCCCYCCGG